MMLFPDDVEWLAEALTGRLELDAALAKSSQPALQAGDHGELIAVAARSLAQRLGLKSGLPAGEIGRERWQERIDWAAAGVGEPEARALAALCQAVVEQAGGLPAGRKTGRSLLMLVDALLHELERLPDQAAPVAEEEGLDARPFFGELVKSLNALLPYAQRDFPAEMGQTQVKLWPGELPPGAWYAVTLIPPGPDRPGQLQMGLHLTEGDQGELGRAWSRQLGGLSQSMGGKPVRLEESSEGVAVILEQPYQPAEKLSAFMTAATLVGLISACQERIRRSLNRG